MLSHLRFHRRAPSNPTSPLPDQPNTWEPMAAHERPLTAQDVRSPPESRPQSSNATNAPPTLPPIARVTSEPEISFDKEAGPLAMTHESKSPPQLRPAYNGGDSGFIGGLALQNFRRGLQSGQAGVGPPTAVGAPLPESALTRSKPPPPPINTGITERPPMVPHKHPKSSSFVAPTDLQNSSASTGKRPAGTRLASEPVSFSQAPQSVTDTQKAKKGLPFLKNPVSTLLMRRKTGQTSSEFVPQSTALNTTEPTYDPRIRGTRVHDFSAPRQKRVAPTGHVAQQAERKVEVAVTDQSQPQTRPHIVTDAPGHTQNLPTRERSLSSNPAQSEPPDKGKHGGRQQPQATPSSFQTMPNSEQLRRASIDRKPLPQKPESSVPPVPPKDDFAGSVRTSSTSSTATSLAAATSASLRKSSPSTKTVMSRNVSLSGLSSKDSVISALPRHMKSTSSRFSFDMIGAAKQEKLLEERHRQRELEKKTVEPKPTFRDSRYDDLDDFDYDAMMDDDGLEERIPGVNADAEDEHDYYEEEVPMTGNDDMDPVAEEEGVREEEQQAAINPDNDQENLSGFVFQRSNPTSELASPHTPGVLPTPRDNNGKVIGFAMTKDTCTPALQPQSSTPPTHITGSGAQQNPEETTAGLGIENLGGAQPAALNSTAFDHNQQLPLVNMPQAPKAMARDELYFDGGMTDEFADDLDFEGKGGDRDGEPFDESIFDENDTDQYGRPIPGAFAQAQARRAAEKQAAAAKRESDVTSRLSAQSLLSQSTAHTSLSFGAPPVPAKAETDVEKTASITDDDTFHARAERLSGDIEKVLQVSVSSQDALYQAALAKAAQQAAASGKFRRDSSPPPPPPTDLMVTSPTTASDPPLTARSMPDADLHDYYDDGPYTQDMDDYDFDDDDIVAEANASALANDSDGFYGQEFGFYSAPIQPQHHGHGSHSGSSNNTAALSAQNLYEYSHGGYFGPSGGLGRSTSGRVVSREPNLTPITERSEYSNRNSIMSLGLPSAIGSAPDRGGLQSPGLAQLAMMADDSDMSLSALLRLRSKAWGGSQVSLSSSREASPRSDRVPFDNGRDGSSSPWMSPPPLAAGPPFLGMNHGRKNSAFSIWSRESDAGSGSGSPTMTANMAFPPMSATASPPAAPPTHIAQKMSSSILPLSIIPSPCAPVLEDETPTEQINSGIGGLPRSASDPSSRLSMRSPLLDQSAKPFQINNSIITSPHVAARSEGASPLP